MTATEEAAHERKCIMEVEGVSAADIAAVIAKYYSEEI